MARHPLARLLQKVRVGNSCTCARAHPFFRISGTARWIALKLGVAGGPLAMRFAKDGVYPHKRTCSRTHFKHNCSLQLVHRRSSPKKRLTGPLGKARAVFKLYLEAKCQLEKTDYSIKLIMM